MDPVAFCLTDIKATGYPRKELFCINIEYKYNVFNNNNVCSAHPEEGLIEGRNVERVS